MHNGSVPRIDTLEKALEQLLNDLCVEMGFCLPPEKQRRIASQSQINAVEFASAVLSAEGLVPEYEKQLLRQISERFKDRFGKSAVIAEDFAA